MFSPLPLHHTYPYPHLNHLLTTQHVMHNNAMPPHAHGLQNHGFAGIGQLHSNVPAGFHSIHGMNGGSLADSKEGSGTSLALRIRRSSLLPRTRHIFIFLLHIFTAYSSLSSVSSSLSSPAISPRNVSPVNPTETSPNIGECSSWNISTRIAVDFDKSVISVSSSRFMQHAVRPSGTRPTSTRLREEVAGDGCATEPRPIRLRAEENLGREGDARETQLGRLSRSHFRLVWIRTQSVHPSHKHDRLE